MEEKQYQQFTLRRKEFLLDILVKFVSGVSIQLIQRFIFASTIGKSSAHIFYQTKGVLSMDASKAVISKRSPNHLRMAVMDRLKLLQSTCFVAIQFA